MAEPRELTEAERERGFTKVVHIRPAGRTPAFGVEIVDVESGEATGHISKTEFERRSEVGGRKFRGELFVEVPPRPEVEVSIRRSEEKREQKELAEKRAEIAAKKAEPTLEEEREAERQARIEATLEKQREFAALTESQQRSVRTLVRQGRKVKFERGVIITEEAGRKVIISPEAIAKVPVTATVDIKELERLSKQIRERKRVEVRPFIERPKVRREDERIREFEQRIETLQKREKEFTESEGFRRIEQLASVITGGRGVPIGQRGFLGQVGQLVVSAPLGLVTVPQALMIAGGKVAATLEGLSLEETKESTKEELLRAAKDVRRIFDIRTPTGVATFVTAGLFALPIAAGAIAAGRPVAQIRAGRIADIKTTIIRFRGGGAGRALGVKVGKRAVVVGVGEPALPIPPPQITGTGLIVPSGVPFERALVPSFFRIPPTEVLPTPPAVLARQLIRVRARETAIRAREQTIQDVISGVIDIKDVTPSIRKEATKKIREEALQRGGISPLDIRPVGIFAPIETLPLVEPPALAKVRVKEAAQRAREQTIEDVLEGRISISEVRPSIRREVRKRLTQEVRTREEFLRSIGKLPEKPRELFFDIERLPIPTFQIVRPKPVKPPKPRKVIRPPKEPEITVTASGQVLILERPEMVVKAKLSKQEQRAVALAQQRVLVQAQAQREVININQLVGVESIQRGRLAAVLGIVPTRIQIIRPISAIDIAEGLTIAQQQAQAQAQARALEEAQAVTPILDLGVAQAQVQAQARTQAQQRAIQDLLSQTQQERVVLEAPTPLGLPLLFKTPKEKRVQLQKPIPTGEQGYSVHVRKGEKRGDKFEKVAEGLPRNKALKRGKRIVDNFVEASYLIRKSKIEPTVPDDPIPPDLSKFRKPVAKSKLPRETLIELARHRIDTIGEKRQLSFFKELAKRKKQQLQTQITFIKKQQQLQNVIAATKAQQVSFISSPKKGKKQKVKPIKFI